MATITVLTPAPAGAKESDPNIVIKEHQAYRVHRELPEEKAALLIHNTPGAFHLENEVRIVATSKHPVAHR